MSWIFIRVIVRTRDPQLIGEADIVVDVGSVYDASKHLYDHHQREFNETFSAKHTTTKLSSAGLIYKHFGKRVIASLLKWSVDDQRLEIVYEKVYKNLIEGFDAIDNGVSQYSSECKPAYEENTGISKRVARLNPDWNETDHSPVDQLFMKAVAITGEDLVASACFHYIANQRSSLLLNPGYLLGK